ncbi:alpha/beta fold hydrolase [Aureimonas ureilytica]|uniref:alpha/beta fold hydrolase n=1 Tax=Aureimonas ureilytica TaxID=401562 RepID=UPI000A3E4E55|nr:alpha/beta hydrolase [Aureimonas ureilytica]
MSQTPDAFVSSPDNPPPLDMEIGYLDMGRGRSLRYALAPRTEGRESRGTILLLQGRNEATEKYFETMRDLNRMGFSVATFDWRGQGRSFRSLANPFVGHVANFSQFTDDLDRFFHEVVLPRCPAPYAILAHSMGGLVALTAMERLEDRVERMVLLAPFVAVPGSGLALASFRLVSSLLHWTGLGWLPVRRARRIEPGTALADNPLTSDRKRFERNLALQINAPDLFVGALSASWLRAVLKAQRRLEKSDVIARMRLPTLFLAAGADRVVSNRAAERLAWRMRSGHFLRVAGARHEMLQEADRFRDPALSAFEGFLASALPRQRPAEPAVDAALVEEALVAAIPDVARAE